MAEAKTTTAKTTATPKTTAKEKGYVVVQAFRDLNDFSKAYEPEQAFDIEGIEESRLASLVEKGLIKMQ